MVDGKKVVAFVPAKGNSRRIDKKNLQILDGQPLFLRQALKLRDISIIDEVVVDTDCEYIKSLAVAYGLSAIVREHNDYDGHELFASEVGRCPSADVYVQCLCTAPFLRAADIETAIYYVADGSDKSMAFVYKTAHYEFPQDDDIKDSDHLEEAWAEGMSCYVVDGTLARMRWKRCYADTEPLFIEPSQAIDIDDYTDLDHAHLVAAGLRSADTRALRSLEPLLSSALLSDCGANTLHGISGGERMIGRACTLGLTERGNKDTTIYDALGHYDYVVDGSVLCINGSPDVAYFGELNSLLARREGAVGAVVNGATRDKDSVCLPVYARSITPHDCRDVLVLDTIQRPIEMGGVLVEPGDLIFADGDGVVHVPKAKEEDIVLSAVESSGGENSVRLMIAHGAPTSAILAGVGEF